jgi:hypothetical protein
MPKRMIDTDIWLDSKIVDNFTMKDTYIWLYLLTSPHTSICGVIKCSITILSFETKMDKEELQESLQKLQNKIGIIKYNEKEDEILILSWYKHNWTKSSRLLDNIESSMKTIKTKEFYEYVNRILQRYRNVQI